jgi:protein-L-isoaspartate(D-aspartate) O-methyltransferase
MRLLAGTLLLAALPPEPGSAQGEDPWARARAAMVEEVREDARETGYATGRPVLDAAVMGAMARVPRHELVPADMTASAYLNRPLPIGHGQTISQPFIVALMTDLLRVAPGRRVLEVGTGSGYQAAVLAEMQAEVYSIELIPELAQSAAKTLAKLGYVKVRVKTGDGYAGWPEHAPFDAIVVTAAPEEVPPALIEQLAPGGRMVIPVGPRDDVQHLLVVDKQADGRTVTRRSLPVRFVPLVPGK